MRGRAAQGRAGAPLWRFDPVSGAARPVPPRPARASAPPEQRRLFQPGGSAVPEAADITAVSAGSRGDTETLQPAFHAGRCGSRARFAARARCPAVR